MMNTVWAVGCVVWGVLGIASLGWAQSAGEAWVYICNGKNLPSTTLLHSWAGQDTSATITNEGMLLDASRKGGRWYFADWGMVPGAKGVVETQLKTLTCEGPYGNSVTVADGVREATFTFHRDRIEWNGTSTTVPFNTSDKFHLYRIEIQGQDLKLFADGEVVIDGTGQFTAPAVEGRNIVGFGCGASDVASSTIWNQVRYHISKTAEQAKIETIQTRDLRVEVGSTVVIVPASDKPNAYFPVFRYRDGRIVVANNYWSKDQGQTWHKGPDGPPGNEGISAIELDNGDVIALNMQEWILEGDSGWYNGSLLRFKQDGSFNREPSRAYIPEGGTGIMDDDNKFHEGVAGAFDHNIVQLPDGDLVATMFGNFRHDHVQIPYFDYPIFKYRTWVMRSSDQGKSWKYLATVAYDPEVGMESFCEPSLVRLPSGDLLCAMRTNGRGEGGPVYLARSTDDGKTWSKPQPITNIGVYPNMIQLDNGVLAMTYGRPNQWLAFSADDGQTWQGHFCYSKYRGSDYNFVVPVGRDRVMAIYYRGGITTAHSDTLEGEIVGTVFTVKPNLSRAVAADASR